MAAPPPPIAAHPLSGRASKRARDGEYKRRGAREAAERAGPSAIQPHQAKAMTDAMRWALQHRLLNGMQQ